MHRVRKFFFTAPVLILIAVLIPLFAEVASDVAQDQGLTPHDLAYYLDENLVNFVRPGLIVKITGATIQNSRISVRFTLTDPRGLPLDREGVSTPGTVSTSFIAAYIPKGERQYTAYATTVQTSPITRNSAVQAATDSGGTYTKNGDGDYTYNFRTTVPATFDPSVTHSIGVYSSRNLSEFDLPTNYSNDVFTFVPDGSPVTVVRDIVRVENCNKCHDPLALHGGSRRDTRLCVLCHQPQTTDPDTGNTVDFKVMIHKIHRGENLPSVRAGKPYQIIGFNQTLSDFSTVAFPDDVRHCERCHTGGTQSGNYLTKPSRAACGACHDDVNFASGEGHPGGPQVSDNMCATCHVPQGELEFDASILGAHTIPVFSQQLPGTTFSILKVDNTAPGQKPTVTFSVKDKAGNVIDPAGMNSLSLNMAGPTIDYANQWSESARNATRTGDQFVYTFTNAIPADAKGSFAMGIEGYKSITINAGTVKQQVVRDAGFNQVVYFGVTDRTPVPRRKVAALENCNSCHGGMLLLHGGSRRNAPEYCVFCHNPNGNDAIRRKPENMPAESIHFKRLIHRIHTGENLQTDFTVFNFAGNPVNFNEVRFPGDRRNCAKCHVNNSQQIPLSAGVLPTPTPRDWMNPTQPIAAACLGCHTDKPPAAHALLMTSDKLGESCEVCHGKNADFSIDKVHAR